jgi:ATP-dependent Zn protease
VPFLAQSIATHGGLSEATTHSIERVTRDILVQTLDAASRLLAEHRSALERLTCALLDQQTLETDALRGLLDVREQNRQTVQRRWWP